MSNAVQSAEERPFSMKAIMAPLVAIIVGLFMVILDNTAVNVAIPGLKEEFGVDIMTIQWTVTGYMLAQAAVIPLSGWLSDRFGAKSIFLLSVFLFTIGSVLCASAGSAEQLVFYRVLQGIGGGMVAPIAMAMTYRLAPPEKVGAVMGMMGVPILLAPALGPVISGWLVEYASWKWIFMINLPVGIVGLLIGWKTLPNIGRQSVASLDILGMLLGPIAFASLSYGVSEGGHDWTSTKTITGLSVGAAALLLFAIVELTRKNPMLELRVFRSWNFTRAIVVQWAAQVAMFGLIFLFPLFLQTAKGYTPFHSGLAVLPQAIAAGIFMPISGKISDKIGARPLVMAGMAMITGAAFWLSSVNVNTGPAELIGPLALLGSGMGMCMMPLNTHLIQAAPQNLVTRVTSLTNALQMVVTSFAVAGLSSYLTNDIKDRMAAGVKNPLDALVPSYADTYVVVCVIAAVGIVLGIMLGRRKPAPSAGEGSPETAGMMVG